MHRRRRAQLLPKQRFSDPTGPGNTGYMEIGYPARAYPWPLRNRGALQRGRINNSGLIGSATDFTDPQEIASLPTDQFVAVGGS